MNWMNSVFYILLLTCLSGSAAFGLWLVWEKYLEQRNCLKCVFPLLVVVLIFFIVPFMYVALVLSIHDFEQGIVYGNLFTRTPFIYQVQCCVAGIWLIGAIINFRNYIREYGKFRTILKNNIYLYEQQLQEQKKRIQKNLGLAKEIKVAMNYGVKVPIVYGWFEKTIVLPARNYTEEELEVIFYHEMTHIKQHILEVKKAGIVLKLVYWFNPLMDCFLNKLDEWGETECDMHVLRHRTKAFTKKQYFDVALGGLEESDIWLPKMVTQLRKERTLKKRVERMKKYKKEKDFRLAGSIAAGCLFLALNAASVYAMGTGFTEIYDKVYEETEVVEIVSKEYVEVKEEPFDETEANVVVMDGITLYNNSISIDWEVPVKTIVKAENAIELKKGDTVSMAIVTDPSSKSMRAGLFTPYGTRIYVDSIGTVGTEFEIKVSGSYVVFVENTDSTAFTVMGTVIF